MDGLKALLEKKRKEKEELLGGSDKKYFKRSELEDAKLAKLREEEEKERQAKLAKKGIAVPDPNAASKANAGDDKPIDLSNEEIIRRLRKLGQPATLFGEDIAARFARLKKAEAEIEVDDEALGGQQGNVLLEIQREERERLKVQRLMRNEEEKRRQEEEDRRRKAEEAAARIAEEEELTEEEQRAAKERREQQEAAEAAAAAFAAAAAALKDRMTETTLEMEDRVVKWIRKWVKDWEDDLAARPQEVAETAKGRQATDEFRATEKAFQFLYQQLESRAMAEDMKKGIYLMVEAMKERNYSRADSILLNAIAIGNAPWPIGVTQVGIHTRAAREKISHAMNKQAAAHIMTNEATRKYLHGLKRLLSAVQRLYPTDPSRSIEFISWADSAKGAAGGGSMRVALLEAEAKGNVTTAKPYVPVPEKLSVALRAAEGIKPVKGPAMPAPAPAADDAAQ